MIIYTHPIADNLPIKTFVARRSQECMPRSRELIVYCFEQYLLLYVCLIMQQSLIYLALAKKTARSTMHVQAQKFCNIN